MRPSTRTNKNPDISSTSWSASSSHLPIGSLYQGVCGLDARECAGPDWSFHPFIHTITSHFIHLIVVLPIYDASIGRQIIIIYTWKRNPPNPLSPSNFFSIQDRLQRRPLHKLSFRFRAAAPIEPKLPLKSERNHPNQSLAARADQIWQYR